MTMRFNGCVAGGRQFLLPMFGMVPVSQIFGASVMLLEGNLAGDRLAFYATTLPALVLGCQA
jgi:hypothetical protein